MEKVKKIINSISWVIVALTGILLIVKWNDIPALVITHIGMGISYGSKNILPMLFCIELVVTFLFTLRYDIPFIREMRKSKVSRKFLDIMAIIIQMVGVVILSLFVLLAVVQWGCKSQLSFTSNLPNSLKLSESVIDGLVGSQLISSILAVSCVTVAFCSNFLMVQDKANGTIRDLRISPVKSATLSLSYYTATLFSTLIICFAATGICLTYVAIVGWNMLLADIFFLFLDILLLVLFGTALSSIINFFLSTQGQISAVGTIISAGYGFICGAYMPISSFGKGLQKIISFLPGTYGTSLIRNHTMQGALAEIQNQGIPIVIIEKLKDSLDCNLYFFGSQVNIGTMYMILGITILVLIGIYILLNKSKKYNR